MKAITLIKNFFKRTYVKYYLSYMITFTVLILGFFLIIKDQITSQYFDQQSIQAKLKLDTLAEQLNDDLIFLSQVDNSLIRDTTLRMSRYKTEDAYRYETFLELNQYVTSIKLIDSIVYMPKISNRVISTYLTVNYEDGIFNISPTSEKTLRFDPSPYFNASSGQLVYLSDEEYGYLVYFPKITSSTNYIFFYTLDLTEILQRLKNLSSYTLPAIALLDDNGQIVVDVNAGQLAPYLKDLELKNGIYQMNSSTSIFVHTGICNNFSLVSLLSNDVLTNQINTAFANAYLTLILLATVGFLLILLAMRITYVPLHQLTLKVTNGNESHLKKDYLGQLDHAFSSAAKERQLLLGKLDHYRLSMQKSLLDSIANKFDVTVNADQSKEHSDLSYIDQFFDNSSNREIFALKIASSGKAFSASSIHNYLQEILPGKDSCIILDATSNSVIFLVNYVGLEPNKSEVLIEVLRAFHQENGFLSAISNGSASPLDIPSLYENVMYASSFWPEIPVADYRVLPPIPATLIYPYDKISQLTESLRRNDFLNTREVLKELFQVINRSISVENDIPDFFIRCILIDMLTGIISCIEQSNIDFDTYNDLYYETLFLCRSCSYVEKAEEIINNINKLIDFFENEFSSRIINATQLKQIFEIAYSQPDFSIALLADKFHVSIAYMSYLIKKELGQNFSEYLWELRLDKAKELLLNSDMTVDEISIAVGYLNTSSFRRKFKQATGSTPSQIRNDFTS